MNFSVLIPTKGRPHSKLINACHNQIILFVEPQELSLYPFRNVVDIQQNDKGTPYVRNFMLRFAQQHKIDFICMCDDDITQFFAKDEKLKAVKQEPMQVIMGAYKQLKRMELDYLGLSYSQFSFDKGGLMPGIPKVCSILRITKDMPMYDEQLEGKADIDYGLQMIQAGKKVKLTLDYSFSCPAIGSNKGGLKGYYDNEDRYNRSLLGLQRKWGNNVIDLFVRPKGLMDVKVNYRAVIPKQEQHENN